MSLYYDSITMEYANVSVRFPEELDREVERFLAETGIYTNKSEFIKDSVRRRLAELHSDPAIAALRTEQLLARAEQESVGDAELEDRLEALRQRVDETDLAEAVETAREETAAEFVDDT